MSSLIHANGEESDIVEKILDENGKHLRLKAFAEKELGLKHVDILMSKPERELFNIIPQSLAKKHLLFPLEIKNNTLLLATLDPFNWDLFMDLQLMSGLQIKPVIAKKSELVLMIEKHIGAVDVKRNSNPGRGVKSTGTSYSKQKPIVNLVNDVIIDAASSGASDIHFEPFENYLEIRLRKDGVLVVHKKISEDFVPPVLSRVKVMANLDIAEKRRPQDGRIHFQHDDIDVDIRVSTLPTQHGEKIVLRILDKGVSSLDLKILGFNDKDYNAFKSVIKNPHGMILVTGPTGSGKTTTLYSALNEIKSTELNISTIEDPIEYKMEGINQTQVKPEIDLTFSNTLRTLLRQDPDVIMVGEIRDQETADLAVRASLTGHLVFSTLHTNDSIGAISRLVDIGVEPFLLASSLSMIVAQRLVRKSCQACLEEYQPDESILMSLGLPKNDKFHKGKGCFKCDFTGYKGRIALFEVLHFSEALKQSVQEGVNEVELKKLAKEEGLLTLQEDGRDKIRQGLVCAEEVFRVSMV